MPVTVFRDLLAEVPVPPRGILSQTMSDENDVELVLFAFAAGERLSEHTSARPAIITSFPGTLTSRQATMRSKPGRAHGSGCRPAPATAWRPGPVW